MRSNSIQEERHSSSSSRSRGTNNLRDLIERRCLAPLTLNDDVGDGNVRNYSYHKLPQFQLLKLSVLKLDGSAFGKPPITAFLVLVYIFKCLNIENY